MSVDDVRTALEIVGLLGLEPEHPDASVETEDIDARKNPDAERALVAAGIEVAS